MDSHLPLWEHQYYHIYNRGNNGENLFHNHKNYLHFLSRYDFYLGNYLDTFAYCLLPNHFHLLVRVKPFASFPKNSEESLAIPSKERLSRLEKSGKSVVLELQASEQFRKFFMSYAKGINNQEGRTGSLFQKNFKRKEVKNERYFNQLVYYIHANPTRHGIDADFTQYPYSSYSSIPSKRPSKLFRKEVLDWFGTKDNYHAFHNEVQDLKAINNLIIEDD